ncbi:MAG: hypothetical protein ACI9Y1_003088 [Lentisphaeria bacterium]|jgi:hypothetical protein
MTISPASISQFPVQIDALHLILAILCITFAGLLLLRRGSCAKSSNDSDAQTVTATPAPPERPQLNEASPDTALQLLALLQQEARLIDFVKEDLGSFSDADIGAVARVVHEGSRKTLDSYFTLEHVRNEEEESRIRVELGFNAAEIRLTGKVVGSAPFTGTLIHRGWKASEVQLPKLAPSHDTRIIAPAEVEL